MAQFGASLARISRDAFIACIDAAMAADDNHKHTVGLLVVRIHNLHRINATFGHDISQKVVANLGGRMNRIARKRDQLYLIGDDEYGLILPDLSNMGHGELAANKVSRLVERPFRFGRNLHHLSITIGIAHSNNGNTEPEQLLRRAELALASAEDQREPYASYRDTAALTTAAAWDTEAELAEAIQNSEFELYYQPQIEIGSNRICGAEGLLRWHHPRRGFLSPSLFIDAAENGAQIRPLTRGALNIALQRASEWPEFTPPLRVAVNISAKLLNDTELVTMITDAASIWGIEPDRLILEITETALMQELDKSYDNLARLHAQGFRISIDDFGTGYSSFTYFRNLPAREIKIDKGFVFNMLKNDKDWDIVESMIDLAHKFNLRVVAEGVTNQPTLDALRDLGCDAAQGYLFAKPMPHKAFLEFIHQYRDGWKAS